MSFLYPDLIEIARLDAAPTKGVQSYRGLSPKTVLGSNIPANVQLTSSTGKLSANLPGDVARGTLWDILFRDPGFQVKDKDEIKDQNGNRYQVMGSFPTPLGYLCQCERLQS